MHPHPHRRLRRLLTLAAALALVACGQADDRSVGQQIDSTVTQVEQKTDQVKAGIKQDMAEAKSSTAEASDKLASQLESASNKVVSTVQDAAITTRVNAELARDDQLSPLRINVDTRHGAVRLLGVAPDQASRDRAARLAAGVKGVLSVDNQLEVRG